MTTCYLDIETASLTSLRDVDARAYTRDPSTRVTCLAYAIDGGDPVLMTDCDLLIEPCPLPPAATIVTHNVAFDFQAWHNLLVPHYGWPVVPIEWWRCTAAAASYCGLPRSLEQCGRVLGIANPKDRKHKALLSKMFNLRNKMCERYLLDPEKRAILHGYVLQDVRACRDIDGEIDLPERERSVFELDHEINQRGIRLDIAAVGHALVLIEQHAARLDARITELTAGEVTTGNQTARIVEFCKSHGAALRDLKKETVTEALGNGVPDIVRDVLTIRQQASATSTKKYLAMDRGVDRDTERIHGSLLYCGSHTGRWTGGGFQPHNLPRQKIKLSPAELDAAVELLATRDLPLLDAIYGSTADLLSTLIRSMIIPSKGCELFVADFAQIEARALAWLAGQLDVLEVFRRGEDVYRETAAKIYRVDVTDVTKTQRMLGKEAVLGCGYGLGHARFRERCEDAYGVEISEAEARAIVQGFRNLNQQIVHWWDQLDSAAHRCVATKKPTATRSVAMRCDHLGLRIALPSGRELTYPKPRIEIVTTPWGAEAEGVVVTLPYQGKPVRKSFYGGAWAENITQALCRDLLVAAMFRLRAAGYSLLLTVHDEIVCERKIGEGSLDGVCELMRQVPPWADGLPVDAEGFSGERYRK